MGFITKMTDDENDEDNDVLGRPQHVEVGEGRAMGEEAENGVGRI